MSKIKINNKKDLKKLQGKEIDNPILLESNIDMEGKRFRPISRISSTFNGNGYAIKNMKILVRSGRKSNVGLTKRNTGEIKNLSLENSIIFCNKRCKRVGGIAGINKGIIRDCSIKSDICGGSDVGGITGLNENEKNTGIFKCTVEGEIEGRDKVGGIAGQSLSIISNCSIKKSDIIGEEAVGGITSRNTKEIKQCSLRNTNIKGKHHIGGIVGITYGPVEDSWYEGNIVIREKESEQNPGNIAGIVKGADINNCYWILTEDNSFEPIGRIVNNVKRNEINVSEKDSIREAKKSIVVEKI